MKVLLICVSVEHGNTRKVMGAMAEVLGASIIEPEDITNIQNLHDYDLIGFGAGIYYGFHHKRLRRFINHIPPGQSQKAFLVTTNGITNNLYMKLLNINIYALKSKLERIGFEIIDDFSCGGISDWAFFKLVGGINKGRPNASDLSDARKFAQDLLSKNLYQGTAS